MLPNVNDQATSSGKSLDISDQAASSFTPPTISEQAAYCFVQSKILGARHVEIYEMLEYPQVILVDEHSVHIHVVENNAGYLQIIDDNLSTFNDEPRCSELDGAISYGELEGQQQGYFSHIEDDNAYQEAGSNTTADLDEPQQVAENELS